MNYYLITDAMGYVDTCFVIAETPADAREFWTDENDPMGSDRSYIDTCTRVLKGDVHKYACDILNPDLMDEVTE